MKVIHNIAEFNPNKKVVVTQGTFDGVHFGHQKILKQVVKEAKKIGGVSVLLTFYPHPRLVLYPDDNDLKLLMTIEEKAERIEELGLDYLIILPFTKALSRLTAFEFARSILVEKLKIYKLIIGYDHRFGRNREGGLEEMKRFAAVFNFDLEEIPAQDIEQSTVSSTKIRKALLTGDVGIASAFLGKRYSLKGTVVQGLQQGKDIGYPTANIRINSSYKLIPKNGVYAVYILVGSNKYDGMLNIGDNPTFNDKDWSIEVHIFDFEKDIYKEEIVVELVARTRGEIKFRNKEELINKLAEDEVEIRELLEN